jgi:SsrA-binding protein
MTHRRQRKAFHDYFIEERFEAGLALEGWEVKAVRAGRAHLTEAYVVVKNGELLLLGAHVIAAHHRIDARARRSDAHAQAADAPRGDQPSRRQGRARGLHADADQPALQERPHQARDRLAKGKKQHDKRATIREREWNREQQRLLRNRTGGSRPRAEA